MPKRGHNILVVNPGTKYLGLAVFEGPDLVYWGIKVLEGRWSKEKLRKTEIIVLDLVEYYTITKIIQKQLNPARSSKNLNRLAIAIEQIAEANEVGHQSYILKELKETLAPGMRTNKMDIAGLVAARYRFLIPLLDKERKKKHPYFIRMFEAIAAGMVVQDHLTC
jgi:hypothetical protein